MGKNKFFNSSILVTLTGLVTDFMIIALSMAVLGAILHIDVNNQIYGNIVSFSALYLILFFLIGMQFNLYSAVNRKLYDILFETFLSGVLASAVIMIAGYLLFQFPVNARGIFVVLANTVIWLTVWRALADKLVRKIKGRQKLLVIECRGVDNTLARKIKYSCLDWFDAWYTGVDMADEQELEFFLQNEFKQYENIFLTQSIPAGAKEKIMQEALRDKKTIYFLPCTSDVLTIKQDMVQFSDTPAFQIKPFGLGIGQKFIKRAMDIGLSLAGLFLLSPIMFITALAVKLDSKGPVIYSQRRLTADKKEFLIYKFRTMYTGAEQETGPVMSSRNDTRITRVGKFLRAARLDEIPQLINILKGEMSIVGPRPERPHFVREFCGEIENYDKRFQVKAGLTGYAQVYANYDTDTQDKLLYDLLYIREYSLMLDIKLLLLTVKAVFNRRSAKGVSPQQWQSRQL